MPDLNESAAEVPFSSPMAWQTTKATASASVSRTVLVVSVRRSPRCSISWPISCTSVEFLGRLHPGKQGDFPAVRQTFSGANLVGVAQFNALRFHELHQPFAIAADIALHFGQLGKLFAFGLRDVEDIHGAKAVELRLRVFLLWFPSWSLLEF
jgi:hypothetical protein